MVPEMRSHRNPGGQPPQAIRIVHHQPRAARPLRAHRGRVSHAAVEDEPVAVDTVAAPAQMGVDLETRPLGLLDVPVADLGLKHDLAGGHPAALVLELAGHPVLLEERARAERHRARQAPAAGLELVGIGQLRLGKEGRALELHGIHHGAIMASGPAKIAPRRARTPRVGSGRRVARACAGAGRAVGMDKWVVHPALSWRTRT